MIKRLGALATVGALTAVLVTGCGSDKGDSLPEPGKSKPSDWCFADGWIDQASYTYGYWARDQIPGPDAAKEAMGYGHRLMDQYQADEKAGKLPGDLDDKQLTAWVVNLATIQEQVPANTTDMSADNALMDDYIKEVHEACG